MKKKYIILIIAAAVILILAGIAASVYFFVKPDFTLKGDSAIEVQVFEDYSDEGCTARYLWFNISEKVETEECVDTEIFGEYTVKYTLDFHNKSYELERKVCVVDTTPPQIILEGGDVTASSMTLYKEPGYTARDNYDGDITENVEVSVGEIDSDGICCITYSVSDSFGNTSGEVRKVTVKDIVPPVITLAGDREIVTSSAVFSDPGYSAADDLDGDITDAVTVETDYKPKTEGKFTFKYTVSDKSGNSAEAARTVTVADTSGPLMTLNGRAMMYLCVGDSYTEPGCYAADDFDGDLSGSISVEGAPDTSVAGTYTVTYSAYDSKGNVSKASRTVRVFEKPSPVYGAVNGNGIVSGSTIYLTFDDGPSAVTPRVLDILKANGVKATFFIINYSAENKWLIERMINEGHTVGIHGYSHDYGTIYSSIDAFLNNVETLHRKLIDDFGYDTNLIRFPGGSSNLVSRAYSPGIMSQLCPLLESMGYRYFDWNVSSGDAAGGYVSAAQIKSNVCCGVHGGRGNVVLMHDAGSKGTTADALQGIIDYGYNNGYTFAGLSSYSDGAHHNIQN